MIDVEGLRTRYARMVPFLDERGRRSPARDLSRSRSTKTPKHLEEALLDIRRNRPGLTPEKTQAILGFWAQTLEISGTLGNQ